MLEIVPSLSLQQALEMPILTAVALGRAKSRLYKRAVKRSKSTGSSGVVAASGVRRQRVGSMAELSEFIGRMQ